MFVITKAKNTVLWTYFISDRKGEEIAKTNEKEFRVEKVIRRKGNKLYVKWKSHDSSFLLMNKT